MHHKLLGSCRKVDVVTVILLDRTQIVCHIPEAHARKAFDTYAFGSFIAGPSKTAAIEQALVIGAHGARDVTVILL